NSDPCPSNSFRGGFTAINLGPTCSIARGSLLISGSGPLEIASQTIDPSPYVHVISHTSGTDCPLRLAGTGCFAVLISGVPNPSANIRRPHVTFEEATPRRPYSHPKSTSFRGLTMSTSRMISICCGGPSPAHGTANTNVVPPSKSNRSCHSALSGRDGLFAHVVFGDEESVPLDS